jgi:NhaA family Na+:H+ antiporter
VWGIGQLAGIGFTMSVFMALLSFAHAEMQNQAKFVILVASLLSAAVGYILLTRIKAKP